MRTQPASRRQFDFRVPGIPPTQGTLLGRSILEGAQPTFDEAEQERTPSFAINQPENENEEMEQGFRERDISSGNT